MSKQELDRVEKIQITSEQRNLIAHALGATPRHHKKDWGYRNYFATDKGCHDVEPLRDLVKKGLMVEFERFGELVFSATRGGAIKVGFKAYQLRGKRFPPKASEE